MMFLLDESGEISLLLGICTGHFYRIFAYLFQRTALLDFYQIHTILFI